MLGFVARVLWPKTLIGKAVSWGGTFLAYTFQDKILTKGKEGAVALGGELAELKEEGVAKYTEGAVETAKVALGEGKKKLDVGANFVRSAVDDPEKLAKETLGLPTTDDFNSNSVEPEGDEKDGSVISAAWKAMTGDFKGAYNEVTNFGVGDMALAGGGGLASIMAAMGVKNWLFGGKDKANKDDNSNDGFGIGALVLSMAVAIGATLYVTRDNEASLIASDRKQGSGSLVSNSFADARDYVTGNRNSGAMFKPPKNNNNDISNDMG